MARADVRRAGRWRRPSPGLVGVGAAMTVSVVACALLVGGHYPLDLRIYLLGGRTVWTDRGLYGPSARIGQYGFTYPPFSAAVFSAFAWLPTAACWVLMTAASLLSLALLIRRCAPDLLADARTGSVAAFLLIAAMCVFEPVRTNLWDGQINLVLAALVVVDLAGPLGERRRYCGALTGIAAAVKLTPALFVVHLAVRRQWDAAGRACAAFALVTGASWIERPGDSHTYWTTQLFGGDGLGDVASARNHALLGLLRRVGGAHATPVWLVLALVFGGWGVGVAARVARAGAPTYALGVVGLTACVVSPVSWSHHWVWFIPAFAGVVAWRRLCRPWAQLWAAVAGCYLVGIDAVPPHVVSAHLVSRAINTNAYLVLAVALVGLAHAQARAALRATTAYSGSPR